ncbi:MAG: MFS transporter [Rhodospirillales bacterium]
MRKRHRILSNDTASAPSPSAPNPHWAAQWAPLAAYAAFSIAVFISQYHRTAMALLAPHLARELELAADRLGFAAASYFAAFALMQLPTGLLLDRFGPRRTTAGLTVLAVLGCAIFALAESFAALVLGQVLMGVGTAAGFMGGVVVCARWFPVRRFATLSGLMLAIGNAGGILAATPLAYGIEAWGWRWATLGLAGAMAADALLIALIVRDAPPGRAAPAPEAPRQVVAGLRLVLASRQVWRLMALAFVGFSTVIAVRGLWGGPYLLEVHGLSAAGAGNVLLAMSLGVIVGAIVYGPMDRLLDRRKGIGLAGGGGLALSFALLALWPQPPLWAAAAAFVLIGACGQTYVIVLAHARAGFSDRLIGRLITTLNTAVFAGNFVMQALSGVILRAFQDEAGAVPEIGYRWVFGFLGLAIAAALAVYATSAEARPSEDASRERLG